MVDLILLTQGFSRLNLTEKYTLICNALSSAFNKLSSVKTLLQKKADWWSPDLRLIKAKILNRLLPISLINNNSNHNVIVAIKNEIKLLKKQFRQKQKTNLNIAEQKKIINLSHAGHSKNKSKFWKLVAKYKIKIENKVDIHSDKLKSYFENIFSE